MILTDKAAVVTDVVGVSHVLILKSQTLGCLPVGPGKSSVTKQVADHDRLCPHCPGVRVGHSRHTHGATDNADNGDRSCQYSQETAIPSCVHASTPDSHCIVALSEKAANVLESVCRSAASELGRPG